MAKPETFGHLNLVYHFTVHLSICCVSNINLLFFMNSLWSFLMLSMLISFFLNNLFYSQV